MNTPAVSTRTYLLVWAILMLLLLANWIQIHFHLGLFNILIALSIAVAQALLGVLFFMHVRSSARLTWVFAIAGFVWLLILLNLTLSDYLSRSAPIHQEPSLGFVPR